MMTPTDRELVQLDQIVVEDKKELARQWTELQIELYNARSFGRTRRAA